MSERPFRIAVLGNFSGRGARLGPVEVDPENFEQVMERLGVSLDLPAGQVRFRELDHFHPDYLYRALPLFQSLENAKEEIASTKTLRTAAPPSPSAAKPTPERPPLAASASLLDQIADVTEPQPAGAPSARSESAWDEAIRKIVAPHVVHEPEPQRRELIAQIDRAAAEQMRAILHWSDLQSLEASWRSLFLLFRYVETGVDLKVYIFDLNQADLFDDPDQLAPLFTNLPVGEDPWSLLVGLYTFSARERDCNVLGRIAEIARTARAPFLSSIDCRLFGCESIAQTPDPDDWKQRLNDADRRAWQQLRLLPDAEWVGLAAPRFLLRLPYGKKTSPIESFGFEEMPDGPEHDGYLWANPAIACACMLGQSFNSDGWDLRPGSVMRLEGMPIHTHATREPTPQAEIWMTDRLASTMLEEGVMPLASIKHSDAVQLVRFQSIAGERGEPRALAGPW